MTDAASRAGDAAPDGPSALAAPRAFRPDIDGLRAVAVILIVGFHAHLAGFDGGFIGVDVFFAISGYLITRNLVAEVSATDRVSLGAFWARRIRRLVPGLALMVLVTLGLGAAVRPTLDWSAMADQGRAAALYVSNLFFARESADYFGAEVQGSLFLHTWSLGVEEQFYLVWPVLVGAAVWVARRTSAAPRAVLGPVFAVTFVASFAVSVDLTQAGSPAGFYGLPSRAWEFAAAGLLAVLPMPTWLGRPVIRRGLGIGGLVGVVAAGVLYQEGGAYPGVRALLPVLATLAVLAAGSTPAGSGQDPVGRLLGARPVRWVGRVSYSWYLWHWPLILLSVEVLDRDSVGVRVAGALVALAVGAAAYHLVEQPLRTAPWLVVPQWRTFAFGAGVTAVVVAVTFGVAAYAAQDLSGGKGASLAEVREARRAETCDARLTSPSGVEYCRNGAPDGARTVLLTGDSHARHWTPAFAEAAERLGIQLLVRWRGRCPAQPVVLNKPGGAGPDPECLSFRRDTDALISEIGPDAVVLANSTAYGQTVLSAGAPTDQPTRNQEWERAYAAMLGSVRDRGMAVGSVIDTPRLPGDPLTCIAAEGADACAFDRAKAFSLGLPYALAEDRARATAGDVPTLDINDVLCGPTTCPVELDGTIVYADVDHLYEGWVRTQAPAVTTFLQQVLGDG